MALPQLRINKKITVRENQSIERYLQQVQSIPLLTIEQEISYTRAIKKGYVAKDKLATAKEKLNEKKREIRKQQKTGDKVQEEVLAREFQKMNKNFQGLKRRTKKILLEAKEAKDKLTVGNLRFVISVAKLYQKRGLSMSDLITEGNIGLIKAAERFDETRGFKFISYAVWWIRQSILQAAQDKGRSIRLPLNKTSLLQKIYKKSKELDKRLERKASPFEVAESLNMDVEAVVAVQEANVKPLSIDAPFKQGEENSLIDVIENKDAALPEQNLMQASFLEELEFLINELDDRQQKVIRDCFGIGKEDGFKKTLEDIGKDIGITRERVRQIKEQTLKELHDLLIERNARFSRYVNKPY